MPTTKSEAEKLVEMADDPVMARCGLDGAIAREKFRMAAAIRIRQLAVDCIALLEANRWIPVGERLPEAVEKVLVCAEGSRVTAAFIDVARWTGECWVNDNWHRDLNQQEVDYWCPLPAPPDLSPPGQRSNRRHDEAGAEAGSGEQGGAVREEDART